MRVLSPNIQQLVVRDDLSPYFLVKLDLPSGTIYHTNTPMDVIIDGLGTFSADNDLLSIDAPRQSSTVDREVYKITYSDNNFAFRALFEGGIVGVVVTVYIGFYNTLPTVLGNTASGQPLANIEDLIIAYKGFIDSHGHTTDVDSQVTAVLEASSPMADLDLVRSFYTSRDSLRQVNPSDIAFDQVYAGSRAIDLLWGKK